MTYQSRNHDDAKWESVVKRDLSARGEFVYAVRTTGVYCQPGCPARIPNRENVVFFSSPDAAEKSGYRPCKKCNPKGLPPTERQVEMIVKICRYLEEVDELPTLNELAARAGLSPWYFQRLFKKVVGLTPKEYATFSQVSRFRKHLYSSKTISEAIYESGYSSSSRAYEKTAAHLAMTPTAFRNGGRGIRITYGSAFSSLGWVVVAATEKGICMVEFGDNPEELPGKVRQAFPKAEIEEAGSDFTDLLRRVIAYIDNPDEVEVFPLDMQGTVFQKRVWKALQSIPPGGTMSYREVAEKIELPKGSRAVAGACASNKIAVLIPCHRVVKQDGRPGGYRWGTDRKLKLLRREKKKETTSK
ncbi:MAG: bifunctional DNA-binding transcriptional regulator/O6-methylguanine-DNA methyltransferase Ada [Calditrichaeota bacterium]|nr:MAG: bifunctional DNA-binding transcriptional regulator/O6-methylguanine-DNA methyltransferase Ada [Calditrichota bacterium]